MSDLWDAVNRMVRQSLADLVYSMLHSGQIVSHSGATCDVRPDNQNFPDLKGAKIYYGVPGVTATITPGGRCVFGWEQGDPSRPFVLAFDCQVSQIVLGGGTGAAADATLLKPMIDNHFHTHPQGPTGPPEKPFKDFSSKKVVV